MDKDDTENNTKPWYKKYGLIIGIIVAVIAILGGIFLVTKSKNEPLFSPSALYRVTYGTTYNSPSTEWMY